MHSSLKQQAGVDEQSLPLLLNAQSCTHTWAFASQFNLDLLGATGLLDRNQRSAMTRVGAYAVSDRQRQGVDLRQRAHHLQLYGEVKVVERTTAHHSVVCLRIPVSR